MCERAAVESARVRGRAREDAALHPFPLRPATAPPLQIRGAAAADAAGATGVGTADAQGGGADARWGGPPGARGAAAVAGRLDHARSSGGQAGALEGGRLERRPEAEDKTRRGGLEVYHYAQYHCDDADPAHRFTSYS